MEVIKRKILLETLKSHSPDISYGTITASTIHLNVFLTQNIDDLGIFTDMPYVDEPWAVPASIGGSPNLNNNLVQNLTMSGLTFPFMYGTSVSYTVPNFNDDLRVDGRLANHYYNYGYRVTGFTDSKLGAYNTYNRLNKYIQNFDVNIEVYNNYLGILVDGRNRITHPQNPINPSQSAITYVNKANFDANIGTPNQTTGFKYTTYPLSGDNKIINYFPNLINLRNSLDFDVPEEVNTTISYIGEGWNSGNTTLSAVVKEEIYLGIVSSPEVQTDVFIDRGVTSALENHLRLSEIESVEHLVRYGNGYYNVVKNNL
jgi:hypothetical protein